MALQRTGAQPNRPNRNTKRFGTQNGGRLSGKQLIGDSSIRQATGANGNSYDVTEIVAESPVPITLSISFTTAGGYVAGTDIPLIPKDVDAALPANVTFSSPNFASYAAYAALYGNQRFSLSNLKISTSDANNFDKGLKVIEVRGDGVSISNVVRWNQLSKNPLNPDQTWRDGFNMTFTSGVQTAQYWLDDMVASTTMTFYFDILGTAAVTPINA